MKFLDIEPIERWIRNKRNPELATELIESLPMLQVGDAWAWHPRKGIHQRFRARKKKTFDSGETPKPGRKKREPRVLSQVDLDKLGKTISEAAARARDSDPKALKKRVTELTAKNTALAAQIEKLSASPKSTPKASGGTTKEVVVEREVKIASAAQLTRIEKLIASGVALVKQWDDRSANAYAALGAVQHKTSEHFASLSASLGEVATTIAGLRSATEAATAAVRHAPPPRPPPLVKVRSTSNGHPKQSPPPVTYPVIHTSERVVREAGSQGGDVTPGLRRILTATNTMSNILGHDPSKRQVALLAKQSPTSGHFANQLGQLRSMGMLEYPVPGFVRLTQAGIAECDPTPMPATSEEIHSFVRGLVKERKWQIVKALIDVYPEPLTKPELADLSGFSGTSGHYANCLGELRSSGFVSYPVPGQVRAEDILFIA